jgi:hypothetical protein
MCVAVTPNLGNKLKKKLRAPPACDKVPPFIGHPPLVAGVTCVPQPTIDAG